MIILLMFMGRLVTFWGTFGGETHGPLETSYSIRPTLKAKGCVNELRALRDGSA